MSGDVWLSRGMALAAEAATWSKDPREQVGAVLASADHRQWAIGVNGLPRGFPDEIVLDRETKNRFSLHAEDNAIANAATDLRGWTLYVTKAPCLRCALAIHRAGICHVVSPTIDPNSNWAADQREAEQFLASNGVLQTRIDG